MNDSRSFPWLRGLVAAVVVALWLIAIVAYGVMDLINAVTAAAV